EAGERRGLASGPSGGIRHTVIRVITAHLKDGATPSWQGLYFDFRGVVFDGADFTGAEFSRGTLDFRGAIFSGGMVNFGGATFSGGTVDFTAATFSRGTVHFAATDPSGATDVYHA